MDANRALGFPDDCREYSTVCRILEDLDVKSIQLMVSLGMSAEEANQVHDHYQNLEFTTRSLFWLVDV